MIALRRSLADHLAACAVLHTRLCPKQVLGVRMARLACMHLDIDPDITRKQIFVFMECGRCAADAVTIVTGASPTNQLMQLMTYGKLAATFVNLQTGSALRVREHPQSRQHAVQLMSHLPTWEAQREAYQVIPDDQLFEWEWVKLLTPIPSIPDKHCVYCEVCRDRINEHCEVTIFSQVLCKACAYGAYYQPIQVETPALLAIHPAY